jgi:hypothetical protein
MISSDTKRQKACYRLRKLISDRVARALGHVDEDFERLALTTHQLASSDAR